MGPIGSVVLTFIGYKQTDRHPDKPNLYRYLKSKESVLSITIMSTGPNMYTGQLRPLFKFLVILTFLKQI